MARGAGQSSKSIDKELQKSIDFARGAGQRQGKARSQSIRGHKNRLTWRARQGKKGKNKQNSEKSRRREAEKSKEKQRKTKKSIEKPRAFRVVPSASGCWAPRPWMLSPLPLVVWMRGWHYADMAFMYICMFVAASRSSFVFSIAVGAK